MANYWSQGWDLSNRGGNYRMHDEIARDSYGSQIDHRTTLGSGYWDYWKNKGQNYLLDPNRSWKTKWADVPIQFHGGDPYRSSPFNPEQGHGRFYGWHDPSARGWTPGVHATTGDMRMYGEWVHGGEDHSWNTDFGVAPQAKVIDYDAYNKDAIYLRAFQGTGGDRISSIADIYAAEDYISGDWQRRNEAKARQEAAAAKARAEYENAQKLARSGTQQLDVSGAAKALGGISFEDYNAAQAKWNQSIKDLSSKWDAASAGYQSQIAGYKADEEQRRRDSSWGAGYGLAAGTGVKGVKTKKDETRGGRDLSTKEYFGRDGTTITNSSLNI